MGQLRDWWPSEDAPVNRSLAIPLNGAVSNPSPPLQLLEAAAVLNEEKGLGTYSNKNFLFAASSPAPRLCPRVPIKLINSEDHKQELLRNLLNPRPVDLPQHARVLSPSMPQPDATPVSPRLPGSFVNLLHQTNSKPSSSSSQQDDMAVSVYDKGTSSPTNFTSSPYHPVDDQSKLERCGVGAHEAPRQASNGKTSSESERVLCHPLAMKDSLTSDYSGNSHGSLWNSASFRMEKSGSSHDLQQPFEKQSEKVRSLHEVQERPINKESLSRREIHIYSERQRRKGMTHLYTTLLSLLPGAKPKTDRCKVLTDAMEYVQTLRSQVEALGSQKAELMASLGEHVGDQINTDYTSGADGEAMNSSSVTGISDEAKEEILSSADVAVRFCGREAFITLNSCKSKGVWSGILQILHEQEMEVFNVTLSSGNEMDHYCIHARIPRTFNMRSQQVKKLLQDLIVKHAVVD